MILSLSCLVTSNGGVKNREREKGGVVEMLMLPHSSNTDVVWRKSEEHDNTLREN